MTWFRQPTSECALVLLEGIGFLGYLRLLRPRSSPEQHSKGFRRTAHSCAACALNKTASFNDLTKTVLSIESGV